MEDRLDTRNIHIVALPSRVNESKTVEGKFDVVFLKSLCCINSSHNSCQAHILLSAKTSQRSLAGVSLTHRGVHPHGNVCAIEAPNLLVCCVCTRMLRMQTAVNPTCR